MDKGYKINANFDVKAGLYNPAFTSEFNFETADSSLEMMIRLPAAVIEAARGFKEVFFEVEREKLNLENERKACENEQLNAAQQRIDELERLVKELKEQKCSCETSSKSTKVL